MSVSLGDYTTVGLVLLSIIWSRMPWKNGHTVSNSNISRLGDQDLALQQILSSIDLFLFYRTDYTDSQTMLNGCTDKCVRLSRSLVGFWTHFKSLHFHSFISHVCSHSNSSKWRNRVRSSLKDAWNSRVFICRLNALYDSAVLTDAVMTEVADACYICH